MRFGAYRYDDNTELIYYVEITHNDMLLLNVKDGVNYIDFSHLIADNLFNYFEKKKVFWVPLTMIQEYGFLKPINKNLIKFL